MSRRRTVAATEVPVQTAKISLCDADRSEQCSWSVADGACIPQNSCRPTSCGLFTCDCHRAPARDLPPWEVLELNLSSALDAHAVQRAFHAKVQELAPDRNLACLAHA